MRKPNAAPEPEPIDPETLLPRYRRPGEPEQLRREGEDGGHADVGFDPERRQNFHLNTLGIRVYHGVPDGFAFNAVGQLHPVPPAEPDLQAEPAS